MHSPFNIRADLIGQFRYKLKIWVILDLKFRMEAVSRIVICVEEEIRGVRGVRLALTWSHTVPTHTLKLYFSFVSQEDLLYFIKLYLGPMSVRNRPIRFMISANLIRTNIKASSRILKQIRRSWSQVDGTTWTSEYAPRSCNIKFK